MNEISEVPGLWIGSLAAVRQIVTTTSNDNINKSSSKKHDDDITKNDSIQQQQQYHTTMNENNNNNNNIHWTIISILDSEKLIRLTKALLLSSGTDTNNNNNNNNSSSCESEQTFTSRRISSFITREDLLWKLPDKFNAEFVSKQLSTILDRIDEALIIEPSRLEKIKSIDTNSNNYNEAVEAITTTMTTTTAVQKQQQQQRKAYCLVHCAQGKSRSAAVCAAWYMTRKKKSLQETLNILRKSRPQIQPNLGLLAGLRAIEQCHGNISNAIQRLQQKQQQKTKKT